MRQRVFALLLRAKKPVGAYELMRLLERTLGRKPAPPSVYRALEFLVAQGFASRIESLNAYWPNADPDRTNAYIFLICDGCGAVAESGNPALDHTLAHEASARHFRVERRMVELAGTCDRCTSGAAEPSRRGSGKRWRARLRSVRHAGGSGAEESPMAASTRT